MRHDEVRKKLLEDVATREEYEKLRSRYEAISLLLKARKEQHITQEELAHRIGTQKSNISRLENGSYNPSLDFLAKVAHGLGKELHIELR
jgi:DNA-binding XRE family transcriptional regulator